MKNKNIKISIIIVNYKVERELVNCASSILSSKPKVSFEIIVVDNDSQSKLDRQLKKNFLQVRYIKSKKNIGYGAGNNLGARYALGDFLFFLNPDTTVTKGSIDVLYNFLIKNSKAGMVAPLLFDTSGNVYPNQGSKAYDLKSAIVTSSFVNKFFSNNPISRKFFHKDWNKKDIEEFDVVPGTAFMIKKDIFEKAKMFDENFFLYFEEYDLAMRIKRLGYKNYIVPKAKILHIWEASTKKRKDISTIFDQSRYTFFKKHYGVFFALFINLVSGIGKYDLALGFIIGLSVFLGLFRIGELMTFIGDQGWFYLSARDMLVSGQIPFVGIASSHPWLHQGPLWTYLLAPFLWIFNFDPVSGAYLTLILGILSIIGIYIVGSKLFSKRVGLIASLLYATSPLAVYYMRFPYHTSPIPLFVITFIYSLYKITQNKISYLPLTLLLLSILYNFEIATVVLWVVVVMVLAYKLLKQEIRLKQILNKKILIQSSIALILPLLPMILYDVRNGFPQTLKFVVWFFYRAISPFGLNSQHEFSIEKLIIMLNFLSDNFRKLIFAQSNIISLLILFATACWVIYNLFSKKKRSNTSRLIVVLFLIPLLLIILNQVPSDAYLSILFPTAILILALFLDNVMQTGKLFIPVFILSMIVFGNIFFMFENVFGFDKSSRLFMLDKRIEAANVILNMAKDKDYNLKGRNLGSGHESFTMNYEYLTWWLGHAPSEEKQNLKVYVSESEKGIKVENK